MSKLENLMKALKVGMVDALVNYSKNEQVVATPKEIAVTLLALSFSVAKKTNIAYPKALAVIMVEACKFDRELAHAAVDDAFDDHVRRTKAKTK